MHNQKILKFPHNTCLKVVIHICQNIRFRMYNMINKVAVFHRSLRFQLIYSSKICLNRLFHLQFKSVRNSLNRIFFHILYIKPKKNRMSNKIKVGPTQMKKTHSNITKKLLFINKSSIYNLKNNTNTINNRKKNTA